MKNTSVLLFSVWLGVASTVTTHAQSITTVYSFTSGPFRPYGNLTLGLDGNFYGTSQSGGISSGPGYGTVFKLTTNGVLTILASFNGTNGASPYAGLTLGPDGNFYGTTYQGGNTISGSYNGYGTVFKVTTNGTLTTLVNFNSTNGALPQAGLTLGLDGNFYGSTSGTLFKITPNGTLTTLVNFIGTNGVGPVGNLTLGPDGNFYGATYRGGNTYSSSGPGYGTVFQMTTNGTLTTLVNFDTTNGANPQAGLTLGPNGNFYGTTGGTGGIGSHGTVFQMTTNGTLTTLVNINGADGAPSAGLTLGPDGNFYGTTYGGGGGDYGTAFKVTTNGTLTTLVNFNTANGAGPSASLTFGPDGNLYGTTVFGGSDGEGTVFKVTTNGAFTMVLNFSSYGNGADPQTGLTLGTDGNFYGTTSGGGTNDDGYGTLFQITTNGTLTSLFSFSGGPNGRNPGTGLTLGPDGSFYGTTGADGGGGWGTVFKLATNGTLSTLVNFNRTNGAFPASLTLGPDGNFYGNTITGGSSDSGTIFKLATNGAFAVLVNINNTSNGGVSAGLTPGLDGKLYGTTGGNPNIGTYGTVFQMTTDGTLTTLANFNDTNRAAPQGLTLGPDGNFYGTTYYGGNTNLGYGEGYGAVFKVTANGALTKLIDFDGTNGAYPQTSLTLGPDGNFYGSTSGDGVLFPGSVFKVTPDGKLTTLANINITNPDLPNMISSLTLGPDGNFYGTTGFGGIGENGSVFRLNLPPDFITAPTNQTVVIGGSGTFNSRVFGTGPLTYQWLSNGVPIAGATNGTLIFNSVVASQLGSYQLIVSNAYGSMTSDVASLSLAPPQILAISNRSGDNFTLYLQSQPNSTNRLWTSTNLAQWEVIATNIMDGTGQSHFLDTNTAGMPEKFYRLSYP